MVASSSSRLTSFQFGNLSEWKETFFSKKVLKIILVYWLGYTARPIPGSTNPHGNRLLNFVARLYHLEPGVMSAPDKSLTMEKEWLPQRNIWCCDQKEENGFWAVQLLLFYYYCHLSTNA